MLLGIFSTRCVVTLISWCLLDAIVQQHKLDDLMREEIKTLSEAIDILNLKHEEYADEIQTYITSHSTDQLEIKRIAGIET